MRRWRWLLLLIISCGGDDGPATPVIAVEHFGQSQKFDWCRAIHAEIDERLELELQLSSSQTNSYFRFWIPTVSVIGDIQMRLGNIDRFELAWDGGQPIQPRTGDQPPDGSGAISFSNDTGLDGSPFQISIQATMLGGEFLFSGTCHGTLRAFVSP